MEENTKENTKGITKENKTYRGLVAHRRENRDLLIQTQQLIVEALINNEPERPTIIMRETITNESTRLYRFW
jgi:hypothetical protein